MAPREIPYPAPYPQNLHLPLAYTGIALKLTSKERVAVFRGNEHLHEGFEARLELA